MNCKFQDRWFPRKGSKGYTLLELMVVSAIISILAAMSFALLSRMRSQVIETNALATLNMFATGYEMYYFTNRAYPQWGPGQRFSSPEEIIDHLIDEEFLPRSYNKYESDPENQYIYYIARDYAVEIPAYNPDDPTTSSKNTYFIVLHPYRFQHDALAIGLNPIRGSLPVDGWVAARARRGLEGSNYRNYKLFVFHRGGAG